MEQIGEATRTTTIKENDQEIIKKILIAIDESKYREKLLDMD